MAAAVVEAGVAVAGGGGGGGNAGGSADSGVVPTPQAVCAKGKIYDHKRNRCVKAERGVLPDAYMTEYAYSLAKNERYAEALDVLNLLENPNTPRALNYRGYATRKLGRVDEGIGYYLKSVALDPSYAQVREYLGEAYIVEGKLDLAKSELSSIKAICGTGCNEYEDLAQALEELEALKLIGGAAHCTPDLRPDAPRERWDGGAHESVASIALITPRQRTAPAQVSMSKRWASPSPHECNEWWGGYGWGAIAPRQRSQSARKRTRLSSIYPAMLSPRLPVLEPYRPPPYPPHHFVGGARRGRVTYRVTMRAREGRLRKTDRRSCLPPP